MLPINVFLSGVVCGLFLTASLFFLKFWMRSKDRLFGFFSLAFFVLAAERVVLLLAYPSVIENRAPVYVVRLICFLLILVAIYDKNRSSRSS